jgi:hypothetical protein
MPTFPSLWIFFLRISIQHVLQFLSTTPDFSMFYKSHHYWHSLTNYKSSFLITQSHALSSFVLLIHHCLMKTSGISNTTHLSSSQNVSFLFTLVWRVSTQYFVKQSKFPLWWLTEMNGLYISEQNIEMLKEKDESLLLKQDWNGTNAVNRELVLTTEPFCWCFLLTTVCSIARKEAASYLVRLPYYNMWRAYNEFNPPVNPKLLLSLVGNTLIHVCSKETH